MLNPSAELLDICLRAAAIGQILLLSLGFLHRPWYPAKRALAWLALCAAGYLLLTAPIADAHYGPLRGWLLLLTDSVAYALWLATMLYFRDDFSPARWPKLLKGALLLYGLWFIYYFAVLQGIGWFHDLNHLLSIGLVAHVIVHLLKGMSDDLIDARRSLRVQATLIASAFFLYLGCVELGPEFIRHHWLFGLSNAALILIGVSALSVALLPRPGRSNADELSNTARAPAQEPARQPNPLQLKLDAFLAQGGYTQPNLTVASLARELGGQEYQLRQLINRELGYRNFSDFLNHHRLPAAAECLKSQDTPITNLALDLGYGSIGPFNRAFKARFACTPSDYRRQFQNRP
ncbi:helix-turn-helix transcriptional regulator [Gilvimarinus algae]|uniref:Helix-turn-helix transcriptional regulator n=1 Tax=Gilvimarinus algae TaxID=3058037 RepID=A0ABT8TIV8_9GAMM|nr:helix-turn-helix transcriptional regulator [Gilvimarinus sp. SDUM040014]MDO3383871.1 helix-turn-helix transcriptional regulator [Gilvimarinus sp. SDUM040014]